MYGHYYDIDYSNDPTIWYYQSHLLNAVEEKKRYEEDLQREEERYWNSSVMGNDHPSEDPNFFYRVPAPYWISRQNQPVHQPTHLPYIPPPPLYRGNPPMPPYPPFPRYFPQRPAYPVFPFR